MHSSLSQMISIHLDVLLSVLVCAVFYRPSLRSRYPWMFSYLCVRAVSAVLLDFLLKGPLLASVDAYTKIYFVVHWASYLISSVLLFLACLDVYRQALAPLPGLVRLGSTVFRWAAIASILVTATTFTAVTAGPDMFIKIAIQLMRCVGTSELCLLAFLLLSMKAIQLSPRSRAFGMAVGLGVMAAIDCAESGVVTMQLSVNPVFQTMLELGGVFALVLWIAYAALPEPARKTVTVRADSAIYKWDQIASALGHKGTQVVMQPGPSFFLVDVEKVVERAFVRTTLKGKESES
jgi:hypothetical protein